MNNNKNNICLTYFITRALFFGTLYSTIFNMAGSDSIISSFLGILIGIFIIVIINKAKLTNKTLSFLTYIFFIILSTSIIEVYVSSYLLTRTPKLIIIIPAVAICLYASFKEMITLKRAANIFFVGSIFSIILVLILLSNYFSIQNVIPFFTHSTSTIFKTSLTFGIISAFPNILLKDEQIPLKNHILYYIITCLINIIMGLFILAILTPNVAKIYSFPEYMVLKRIKLFSFVENIENLSVLFWYIDYFFFLTLCYKKLNNLFNDKVLLISFTIIINLLITFCITSNYAVIIELYHSVPLVFIILLILLILFK